MKTITREQVLAYVENLSLRETRMMVELLKERLDVDDRPRFVRGAFIDPVTDDPTPEQTEFDVVLTGLGNSRIAVIREVRAITGLGLKESKTLAEATPATIREHLTREDAEALKAQLEAAGGTVELK